MKNLLKHIPLLLFWVAALFLVQGCSSDDDDEDNDNNNNNTENPLNKIESEAQKTLLTRFVGENGRGRKFEYSSFKKDDGEELSGWDGFEVEFKLNDDGNELNFTRVGGWPTPITAEMTTEEAAKVWPNPGKFTSFNDNGNVTRSDAGGVNIAHDGTNNIKITLTIADDSSIDVDPVVAGLVGGAEGEWVLILTPST